MIKLTNRFGYPQWYVDAVKGFMYDATEGGRRRSDASATSAINPLQQIILMERYGDQAIEDVADQTWRFLGSAAHEAFYHAQVRSIKRLQRAAKLAGQPEPQDLPTLEERMYLAVPTATGVFVYSGKPDRICYDMVVRDLKVTSAWKMVFDKEHREWRRQLSVYNALGYAHGLDVIDKGQNCVVLRDWDAKQAIENPDYPQANIMFVDYDLASPHATIAWMAKRAEEILAARELSDEALPPCSDEDMWVRDEVFAVYRKEGQKASSKNFTIKEFGSSDVARDAAQAKVEEFKAQGNSTAYVEHRPGRRTRCEFDLDAYAKHGCVTGGYCKVAPFCQQHLAYLMESGLMIPQPAEPALVG